MKILPNGQVEITNGDTGEKRTVSAGELSNYGIDTSDYKSAVEAQSIGQPVKTYNAPALNGQSTTAYNTPPTTPTPLKIMSVEEKKKKLLSMGYPEAEVNKALGIKTQSNSQKAPLVDKKSVGGFLGNVAGSAGKNLWGIGDALVNTLNPNLEKNTIANLVRLPIDAGAALAGDKSKTNRANALIDFYKNRYGSWDKAGETLYNDPVGVALDASVVLGGSGAVASELGTVSKSSRLSEIGNVLSKTGQAVDPIAQTNKVVGMGLGKIRGVETKVAENAAARSVKATPKELENFEKVAGTEMGSYMKKKGIYTIEDLKAQKKVVQGMYDDTVKTGTTIPGKTYADAIRKRAAEIEAADRSPGARKLVADLRKEADVQQKIGKITDTQLTRTKTGEFNKAGGAIADPAAVNLQKELGIIGMKTLDRVAPGASRLGKELQILTELEDVIKSAKHKGLTTNRLNILKPAGAGASVGAAGGFAVGGPAGAAVGAGLGGVVGAMIDSKTGQRVISKVLGAKPPAIVSKVGGKVAGASYQIGKAGSRLNPQTRPNPTDLETKAERVGQATQEGTYDTTLPQSPQDIKLGQEYATGKSPEYWNAQYQRAMSQNPIDEVTAKYALEQRDYETTYQKTNAPAKNKPLSGTQVRDVNLAKNGLRGLDVIKEEFGYNDQTGQVGPDAVNKVNKLRLVPFHLGSRKLYKAIFDAAGARLRIESGAALSTDEIKRYVDDYIGQIADDPAALSYEVQQLNDFLSGIATQQSEIPDYPYQGLGATPPPL